MLQCAEAISLQYCELHLGYMKEKFMTNLLWSFSMCLIMQTYLRPLHMKEASLLLSWKKVYPLVINFGKKSTQDISVADTPSISFQSVIL